MSESASGVNRVTKQGGRKLGVERVVQILNEYPGIDSFTPGIDSFTLTWIEAGGKVVKVNGSYVLQGRTKAMTIDELAKVVKVQSRVTEAKQRGRIKAVDRLVQRPDGVRSIGYKVSECN